MPTISSLGIGSGLDLNGLLDQLQRAEREKLVPLTDQKRSYRAKISAYGQLKSVLSQLQTSADKLSDNSFFSGVKVNVTGDAVTANPSNTTPAGTYQLEVTALARTYSIATTGIVDQKADLGAGTITLSLGTGQITTIEIGAEDSSLIDIRDAINASNAKVSASIVNDGGATPFRLILSAAETGTEASITAIDFGDLSASLATDPVTEITAQNAALTVNGISITSQSNEIDESIQGVTLKLVEVGSATLLFERDTAAISKAIERFVADYNKLQEKIAELTHYDAETEDAGDLLGDRTTRSIQSGLRFGLSSGGGGGPFSSLSDIGISRELGGALKIDEDVLKDIIADQGQALADFFAGDDDLVDGLADNLGGRLHQMLKDAGLLDNAEDALTTNIEILDQRYERVEETIEATIERYRRQFGQLDALVATMQATSSYLAQQFDVMNAQLRAN